MMSALGRWLLIAVMMAGGLGPRVYHIFAQPDLTEAQMLRMWWWAYVLVFVAFALFVFDFWNWRRRGE